MGINVDAAEYIAGMIQFDRGIPRTLKQTFYGDEEKGFAPNKQFVFEMTENYPELWEVAQRIEGLISGVGQHAGGVIFVDEPFTNSSALMKSPKGETITQFDLHAAEKQGLIKYDILSVKALDKIHLTLDLLADYGHIERKPTLRETYESVIGVYNLERDNEDMWKMAWNHKIRSLFQMEEQSGIQGIALTHPKSVDDLATLNSVIRLMAQEKGAEQPLNKYARFKEDISLWYKEMDSYGLTKKEQELLESILGISYGLCIAQEQFMQLVQIPECGGYDLTFSDRLRKSIAKKNPAEYDQLTVEYFKNCEEKGLSKPLCNYVWNVCIATSRGYGFNSSHTLAYSIIGLQEMNLAFRYPVLFWNCACLIAESGGDEEKDDEEENWNEVNETEEAEENEEIDEEDDEEKTSNSLKKKKKKPNSTNYGKMAAAIGKMKSEGVMVMPPDINKSSYTFSPDEENNIIRYGLSGITRLSKELIRDIIDNRPYTSLEDFLDKNKLNVVQIINLIKSGAFDSFDSRTEIMKKFILCRIKPKKELNLRNMKMLMDFELIPQKYDLQCRIFNFNKYLKSNKLDSIYYGLDTVSFNFYEKNFSIDELVSTDETESGFKIKQKVWDKIYTKQMDVIRKYIKDNLNELLDKINNKLFADEWDKYCSGNLSKWEMDSVSYYSHEHELEKTQKLYDFDDFTQLPEEPEIEDIKIIKGKQVPIFKLSRIAGTVLDRNKNKRLLTLLTTSGVVTVKIFGDAFVNYDKRISEKGADGKKHVIENSWFSRGEKLIITGIRRDDVFIAKKYAKTPYHLVERIVSIDDNGLIETVGERAI